MSHYDTLGVSRDATPDEIKKQFRKLAMKHHPDRGGDEQTFKAVNEAYDILSDPRKRAEYDQPAGFGFNQGNPFEFNDIFNDFFRNHRRPQQQKNPDAVCDITISLYESYSGTEKIINLGDTKIKMIIPAGTRHGTNFNLAGKAPKQHPHIPNGDLIVRVHVLMPSDWERAGNDLYIRVEVNYFEAIVGTEVEIIHLNNKRLKIKVPKLTSPGSRLRLSGYGMPDPDTGRHGNLIAIVEVVSPTLSEDQLQRFNKFINKEM